MGSGAKRRTITGLLVLAVALAVALGACGSDGADEDSPPSTVAGGAPDSPVTPTTAAVVAPPTTVRVGGAAATCASLAARGVDLFQRWRNDMRGVAGPQNEAEHRAEASALVAEARNLGCPVPAGAEGIIDG